MTESPIEGEVMLMTAAKASVPPKRLPDLLAAAQEYLAERREEYRRQYECVYETDDAAYFLAADGHWAAVGSKLEFDDREIDAVRRAHDSQLLHEGRRLDRREEFEAALDVRESVVIGR